MTLTKPSRTSNTVMATVSVLILGGVASCGGGSPSTSGTTRSPSPSAATSAPAAPSRSAAAAQTVPAVPVESNPPGDIPDNLAFVRYTNRVGCYTFTHPEGWARTGTGARVRFTDKLNGVAVTSFPVPRAPTVSSARTGDVARLRKGVPAFALRGISPVTVPGGKGVRIVFRRNSAPDPVTGRVYRDEVEEYVVFRNGRQVRMDLYGPVGADNVDAYRTMSQSLDIR